MVSGAAVSCSFLAACHVEAKTLQFIQLRILQNNTSKRKQRPLRLMGKKVSKIFLEKQRTQTLNRGAISC
ncbi:hypothetical protein T05_10220, partial [Trichinella murrelli]